VILRRGTAPNGGDVFPGGSQQSVTWSATDNIGVDSVSVDFSLHGPLGPWVAIQPRTTP